MRIKIMLCKNGKKRVTVVNNSLTYALASVSIYLIVNKLWMMWEISQYGSVKPDHFDGLILMILSMLVGVLWYFIDVTRTLIKSIEDNWFELFEEGVGSND